MLPEPPKPKYKLARRLRGEMSPPEVRLWLRLRSRKETGVTIRRQHPLGRFVLDFYCPQAKLAIEVDGVHHTTDKSIASDTQRDEWLAKQGIDTLRIPAFHIMEDADIAADGVMSRIHERIASLLEKD